MTVLGESTVTVKQTTATGYAADPIELQFDQNLRTTGTGIVTEQVHKTKLYNFLCHEFLIFFATPHIISNGASCLDLELVL